MFKRTSSARIDRKPSHKAANTVLPPYPTDGIPGARDVASEYGSTRLYEWGPENGQRVLFIHGLSTPAPALAALAMTLSRKGCHVMIIDLWGRGYSDNPPGLPHDARLYSAQIFVALASSPVSWTGHENEGFTMVGYSMGAGIAVSFAAHQPHLVSSLILMAPGGLYRTLPAGYSSIQLRYPRLFPSRYLQSYIRKLLNGTPDEPYSPLPDSDTALSEEQTDTAQPGSADLLQKRQPLDVVGIVNWEIEHCPGFVPSVINALKHAPLVRQDATWRLLRSHLVDHKADGAIPNRLRGSQVLILLGSQDTVLGNDFPSIASDCLGRDTIIFASFDAGHDFPVRLYEEVGETIAKYLGLGNGVPVFDDL